MKPSRNTPSMPPIIHPTIEIGQSALFEAPFSDNPSLPILSELGQGPLHRVVVYEGLIQLEKFASRFSRKIIRSDRSIRGDESPQHSFALFRTQGGSFISWGEKNLLVFSKSARAAERIARVVQRFIRRAGSAVGTPGYLLLKETCMMNVEAHFVEIKKTAAIPEADLPLLYGRDMTSWNEDFLQKFNTLKSGLTILEGPPGCGKTYFIRNLVARHAGTHRFYFMTPDDIGLLGSPEFIGFWSDQRKRFTDLQCVLIIEDSEKALRPRANDNRNLVSNLLNYSDGLLGDFMNLQILCTINCKSTELDPALLRPGRLVAHRIFSRLSREEALCLTSSRGLALHGKQEDYSLAEIFNPPVASPKREHRVIGFGK
jgi:hypothetical protein